VLLVCDDRNIGALIAFASRMLPDGGMIDLRGMVTVPAAKSLSEGALGARALREALGRAAHNRADVHDEVQVYVDYMPLRRALEEVNSADLLIAQWDRDTDTLCGNALDTLFTEAKCDVVLVSGIEAEMNRPVLLSLRGGPNLSLGIRAARALAGEHAITLFHATMPHIGMPDLSVVTRSVPQITRTVTTSTHIVEGIAQEAQGHGAVVMGAAFRRSDATADEAQPEPLHRQIIARTNLPMVLVRGGQPEPLEFHAPRTPLTEREPLSQRVDRWFAENTFHSSEFSDLAALLALKERQGVTISVALPALNEEETVGNVIRTLKQALMDELPLVDEIVLIDSDSTDRTREIAADLGVPVYIHQHILADVVGSHRGKGEALWKSLHVTKGDVIAWVDTDITNIHPRFIYGLIGPLLKRPRIHYVKGYYTRPIQVGGKMQAYGGGRVTELVARPLLNLFYPELSGIIQPLSGEYAGRRAALEQMPFFSGYGVETGLLIDLLDRYGLEGIAQTDLEVRVHHNQPLENLSKMSFAILQVFIARLERRYGVQLLEKANRSMKMVIQEPDRFGLDIAEIGDLERPAMLLLDAYRQGRAAQNTAARAVNTVGG
jgi:glucosyl-3-phosphoglycerate synthase